MPFVNSTMKNKWDISTFLKLYEYWFVSNCAECFQQQFEIILIIILILCRITKYTMFHCFPKILNETFLAGKTALNSKSTIITCNEMKKYHFQIIQFHPINASSDIWIRKLELLPLIIHLFVSLKASYFERIVNLFLRFWRVNKWRC